MRTRGKRLIPLSFITILALLAFTHSGNSQTLKRYQFEEPKMGSPFQIILYSKDRISAQQIAAKAYKLIDSLNLIFSDYEVESELNKLSQTAGKNSCVQVSPLLYDLLRKSRNAWQLSERKFDITVGTLSKLWRDARRTGQFPNDSLIQAAKARTGMQYVLMDSTKHSIQLTLHGMQLDMGGIAKGFIAQYVLDFLNENGFPMSLTNAGGDISFGDAPPGKDGWSVAVSIPLRDQVLPTNLILKNQSIATSGNMYQFLEHNGRKYSHEIDPQTGYGIQSQRSVTVISSDGALSDWLATACSVLSIKKSKKLADQLGAELLILEIRKGKLYHYHSKGFPVLWQKNK